MRLLKGFGDGDEDDAEGLCQHCGHEDYNHHTRTHDTGGPMCYGCLFNHLKKQNHPETRMRSSFAPGTLLNGPMPEGAGSHEFEQKPQPVDVPDRLPSDIRNMKSQRVSQLIYKAFTPDGRDADRIRITEARIAYNTARIDEMIKSDVPYIEWRAQPDCCGYCSRLYKNADGSYKKFPMDEFMRGLSQTGGLNKGVSKLAWSPYVVIAHPNCRCRPFPSE